MLHGLIEMDLKYALEILLQQVCCDEVKDMCNEQCCPLFGSDCEKQYVVDKEIILEAVKTCKNLYDGM